MTNKDVSKVKRKGTFKSAPLPVEPTLARNWLAKNW